VTLRAVGLAQDAQHPDVKPTLKVRYRQHDNRQMVKQASKADFGLR